MDAASEEDLTGVDIADTGDFALVKEEILDPLLARKKRDNVLQAVRRRKGVDTESAEKNLLLACRQVFHSPEPALVAEREEKTRSEMENEALVWKGFPGYAQKELSSHPQVDEEGVFLREFEEQAFSVAEESLHSSPDNGWQGKAALRVLDAQDGRSFDVFLKAGTDGFHFGEFRHRVPANHPSPGLLGRALVPPPGARRCRYQGRSR